MFDEKAKTSGNAVEADEPMTPIPEESREHLDITGSLCLAD